jgi:hypothetical protein
LEKLSVSAKVREHAEETTAISWSLHPLPGSIEAAPDAARVAGLEEMDASDDPAALYAIDEQK